jgi:hypothetical protein
VPLEPVAEEKKPAKEAVAPAVTETKTSGTTEPLAELGEVDTDKLDIGDFTFID